MFEARLTQGSLLKKLVDAIKELCKEVNWDISTNGISMQSMDSSHVCLVAFNLRADGFDHFRCDRPLTLGINLENLAKILKCAGSNDIITMKADDNGDTLTLMFESEKQDRISDVDLKLMSIESEHLGIPEQDYSVESSMPSSEYQRIVRDLASIGDTVSVSATKEGIKFSTTGDIGTANITLRYERMGLGWLLATVLRVLCSTLCLEASCPYLLTPCWPSLLPQANKLRRQGRGQRQD